MRAYRLLLALIALALIAALATWAIGSDPGYVLIQRGGWIVESTLVFTVIALLALAVAALVVVALLRWPMIAMQRRRRREGRAQLVRGALALAEGRTQRAEHAYARAAKLAAFRIPALIGVHDAAARRGDAGKRDDAIARLAALPDAAVVANVLRARHELAEGRAGSAIEMLGELERDERLPPAGAQVLVESLVARGRAREALGPLSRLRRGQVMSDGDFDRFEAGVLAQALTQASDVQSLRALWGDLNRNQRRDAVIAAAYARRARALKLVDATREIEGVLRKQWAEPLAVAYATLPGDPAERLRVAESLLREHPGSGALQLALGILCGETALWGKAEAHLQRALALGVHAPAWEALGEVYARQADHERAARAYANAFAAARGEPPAAMTTRDGRSPVLTALTVVEERDAHGVPRLPDTSRLER